MKLKTQNLILRTVTHNDVDEVARTWEFKGGVSRETALNVIDWMSKTRSQNQLHHISHICFAVYEEGNDHIIGWCGLDGGAGANKDPEKIEIFYLIDEKYRKKGYATLCGEKLLEYGFKQMKVPRIHGGCAADNHASKRVLEKIGMKHMIIRPGGKPKFYLTIDEYLKSES